MSRPIALFLMLSFIVAGCTPESDEVSTTSSSQAEVDHGDENDEHENEGEHEEGIVHLTLAQQEVAGIVIETLMSRVLEESLTAPGEVRLNAYATYQVAPRISAQVVERHARLGDTVESEQPLVTLSSVEMAEAQGALLVAAREWVRVQGLGREVVSDRRYIEAEVAAQQARARVLAYGMLPDQIEALVRGADASQADGGFTLLAPNSGTIVRDDFVVGEAIEPGRLMFEITDESTLWIEARLPVQESARVAVGDSARINIEGRWIDGRVIQAFHAVDESTRTLPVRVEIANPDDELHPGLFVDVVILEAESQPVLAVPDVAVLRSADGDWQVYVAISDDEFQPVEVEVEKTVAGFTVINGVDQGTRIVTEGGFFLQSELAKAGFDIHAH